MAKINDNNSTTSGEEETNLPIAAEMSNEMPAEEVEVDKDLESKPLNRVTFFEVFYVEAILSKRICNGVVQYKIRWEGYGEEDDTWEYIDNCHCPDLIAEFEKENTNIKLEHYETDEMKALREGKKNKRQRHSRSQSRMRAPKPSKRRNRKSRIANKTVEGPTNTSEAAPTNEEGNAEFVPLVEKDHYRVMDEGIVVYQIIGMRQMGVGIDKKIMALVEYVEDGGHEYVPLSELRKNVSGKELLLDYLMVRIQLI